METTVAPTSEGFKNVAGPIDVRFDSKTGDAQTVRLENGNAAIGYSLEGAASGRRAKTDGSSVSYAEVLPDTDLLFEIGPDSVKETVVLKSPPSDGKAPKLRFPVTLDGVRAKKLDPGIEFRNANDEPVFRIPNGLMWDSSEDGLAQARPVPLHLETSTGKAVVELLPDQAWLTAPEREYPVFIDPTFLVNTYSGGSDTTVLSSLPDWNWGWSAYGGAGRTDASSVYRTFLKFDLSPISGKHILDADLSTSFMATGSSQTKPYSVQPVSSAWSDYTMTWPDQPSVYGESIADNAAVGETRSVSITPWVRNWTSGTWNNQGVRITASETDISHHKILALAEYSDASKRPALAVTYDPDSSSIGGVVFDDSDRDGTQNAGENGHEGVSVVANWLGYDGVVGGGDDESFGPEHTASDGAYLVEGLPGGAYEIHLEEPTLDGLLPTTSEPLEVTLDADEEVDDANFGLATGKISGELFHDLNSDGDRDDEPGLDGLNMVATGPGPDGELDTSDDETLDPAVTDADGNYSFDGLLKGPHRVAVEDVPPGFSEGADPDGGNDASAIVTVDQSDVTPEADFALTGSLSGSAAGVLFDDENGDGVPDPAEERYDGADIELVWAGPDGDLETSDDLDYAATTAGDGSYTFEGLAAGTYAATVDEATLPSHVLGAFSQNFELSPAEPSINLDFPFGFPGSQTVNLDPAKITTIAGSGAEATIDGEGESAAFREMGGAVVVGPYAYVGTQGSIRKVNVNTGAVSTLAGHPTAFGCVDSTDPSSVRLSTIPSITSDGKNLFSIVATMAGCSSTKIRKTSLATGATTTLATLSQMRHITMGPDGFLYVSTGGGHIYKVNASNGTVDGFVYVEGGSGPITADKTHVYAHHSSNDTIRKIEFGSGNVTTFASSTYSPAGLQSAGNYLYVARADKLWRYTKADGTRIEVAGTGTAGYADGTSTEAWFSDIGALASDGSAIWVADRVNRRLRRAIDDEPLPFDAPGEPDINFDTGAVSTAAGDGDDATVDGSGTEASFRQMGAATVSGDYLYVATVGSIRRVRLADRQVTTLAGHETLSGSCVDSADPDAVRFPGVTGGITSDGYYLYVTSCGWIRRVSTVTGATSTVSTSLPSGNDPKIAFGPDGYLYVLTGGQTVSKVDRFTGAVTPFATLGPPGYHPGISADATGLWVLSGQEITRVELDGSIGQSFAAGNTRYIQVSDEYIYAAEWWRIKRFRKSDGATSVVAGVIPPGHADGPGTDAWFQNIAGLAGDDTTLWVLDDRRIRAVTETGPLPSGLSPGATTTLEMGEAGAGTYAGDGQELTRDGSGIDASIRKPRSVAVVGPRVYVSSPGSWRTFDLTTNEVTTLAGSPDPLQNCPGGCGAYGRDAVEADEVTTCGPHSMTTDGYYIYSLETGCGQVSSIQSGIRRTSLATGATSAVADLSDQAGHGCSKPIASALTYGGDGYLYVSMRWWGAPGYSCATGDTDRWLLRIDPVTGEKKGKVKFADGIGQEQWASSLAADDDYIYAAVSRWNSPPLLSEAQIYRIGFDDVASNDADFELVDSTFSNSEPQAMTSAGDYLYVGFPYQIVRFSKGGAPGSALPIAGSGNYGYNDEVGELAEFNNITGLASDGNVLWVADQNNNRLRAVGTQLPNFGANFGWSGYGGWWGGVNAPLGNYVYSAGDARAETAGPPLALDRTYNSLDPRVGDFGVGWTHSFEMTWEGVGDGGVSVLMPDGRRDVFEKRPDGTYKAPTGSHSTLSADGEGGFLLKTKDDTTYRLNSSKQLVSVSDSNDHRIDLTYNDGQLQTATDEISGRTLHFDWGSDRITQISTDSVGAHGGALTWRYYYDAGRLHEACDPRDNASGGSCTTYDWTSGRLTKVTRPRGNTEVELAYSANGRVQWREDGQGHRIENAYPIEGKVSVTDPRGKVTEQLFDSKFRVTKETDPEGGVTEYEYNAKSDVTKITDAMGHSVETVFDERGNPTREIDGEGRTTHNTYDGDDNLTAVRDPRSASGTDPTYAKTYSYDAAGNKLSEHLPPTPDQGSGITRTWTYTTGSEQAVGGGVMPAGLVRTETDGRDATTTHAYDSKGDLRQTTAPSGLVTTYTLDELGRQLTETATSDSEPGGVTTSTTYDKLGNVLTTTEPAVENAVSGEVNQRRITKVYDDNGKLIRSTETDLVGDNPERITEFTYDTLDREISRTDPEGGVIERVFDGAGNIVSVTDPEDRETQVTYDDRNLPTQVTLKAFVDDPVAESEPRDLVLATFEHDDAGRRTVERDALGRTRRSVYDETDRLMTVTLEDFENLDESTRDVTLESFTYDAAGNMTREVTGDGLRTVDHTYDAAGRRVSTRLDPGGLDRLSAFHYDAEGNSTRQTVSQDGRTEERRFSYDAPGRLTTETVENGASDLTTTHTYDQRGVRLTTTDPKGNTSDFVYDELGRVIRTRGPEVDVETYGLGLEQTQPSAYVGYDMFGAATHEKDARGHITVEAFDGLGRRTEVVYPEYTTPGGQTLTPVESFSYDAVGNLLAKTSRRSQTTNYRYDALNRVVQTLDPLLTGETERGTTRVTYDDVGNVLTQVDATGARQEWIYDALNRVRESTVVVSQDGNAHRTTTADYDDLGSLIYERDPAGAETRHIYNAAGERTATTDAADEEWTYEYDLASRLISQTDPLGRATTHTFDQAGRESSTARVSSQDDELATSYDYDPAGNRTSVTTPEGRASEFSYDAANRLSAVTQPVGGGADPIEVTYGYDKAGNHVRTTDGRGNATWRTYTPWNLPETTIEPSTAAHPTTGDRSWETSYDAGGLAVTEEQPGGVTVDRTFDELGRLVTESGSGGGAAAASRSFGYDLVGRRTSASHPEGAITFTYDDRGLMREAGGPAGASTFTYDEAGRTIGRSDPAGTHTFTYTPRGELATAQDGVAGTTRTYSWNAAGEVTGAQFAGGAHRIYGYDDFGRLSTDVLEDNGGLETSRETYGYDDDGKMTTRVIDYDGNAQSGSHSYAYDGASRLASWTSPAGTTNYDWDASGNRTQAGAESYSYDERNRLLTGGGATYEWSARGTVQSRTEGSTVDEFDFDALGRMVEADGIDYSYDALDRIASREAHDFWYQGAALDPVSANGYSYARSPSGRLLAVEDPQGASKLAGLNAHGDLTTLHSASGAVSSTRVFSPFGKDEASTGSQPEAGFQGDFTDPDTGLVWMGARWYAPETAMFTARDTVSGELQSPVSLNRYTYAFGAPLDYADPDGHYGVASQAAGILASAGLRGSLPYGVPRTLGQVLGFHMQRVRQAHAIVMRRAAEARSAAQRDAEAHHAAMKMTIPVPLNGEVVRVRKPSGWEGWTLAKRSDWIASLEGGEAASAWFEMHVGQARAAKVTACRSFSCKAGNLGLGIAKGLLGVGKSLAKIGMLTLPGLNFIAARDIVRDFRATSSDSGGGWRGFLDALNSTVNPAVGLLSSGERFLDAKARGDWEMAGESGVHTGVSAVATVGAGLGLAKLPSLIKNFRGAGRSAAASVADDTANVIRAGDAGSYAGLQARSVVGDALDLHHMPQAAAGFTSRGTGGAIAMPHAEHALTRTYGIRGVQSLKTDAGSSFRQVLARDISDVRSIVGSGYNQGLRELIGYYRTNFPELMARGGGL